MPISPNIGAEYAEEVARYYRDAELLILQRLAAALREGIDAPDWEVRALARAQEVRERVIAELNQANPKAAQAIQATIAAAYSRGGASVLRDAGAALPALQRVPPASVGAVVALVRDTATALQSAAPGILRQTDDVFRQVVSRAATEAAAGAASRLDTAQRALVELTRQGIGGIQVGRGTMSMPDYLSMAVRTATSRAALEGSIDTMHALDLDLVIIHPGPRSCDTCDWWASSILSTTGSPAGTYTYSAVDGSGPVEVEVDGSLDDARLDGWGHPNCRCGMGPYLPGVTDTKVLERPKWDAEGYQAQQQQRAIERAIRTAKLEQAASLSPEAKAHADALVRDRQATMREHLAQHPDLKRQSDREQVGRVL